MNKGIIIVTLVIVCSITLVLAGNGINGLPKEYGKCLQNCSNEITHLCKAEYNQKLDNCTQKFDSCALDARNTTTLKKVLNQKIRLCRSDYLLCKKTSESERKNCQLEKKEECQDNCKNQTAICLNVSRPVCGDDNITYVNKCWLDKANFVKKACSGECPCKKNNGKNESNKKTCEQINDQIKNEITEAKKCESNTDCIIGSLGAPCSFEMCNSAYNKNFNLTKLKDLTKEYNNLLCKQVCPMYSCINPSILSPKCIEGSCKTILKDEQNKCTERPKICPMIYDPVCGWFDGSVQCFRYPCAATYPNSCVACSDKKVDFWTQGECPK